MIVGDKINDPQAFIFSLKNPYDTPKKLKKLPKSQYSITRNKNWGPTFVGDMQVDLRIEDESNISKNILNNTGQNGYESVPQYGSKFFMIGSKDESDIIEFKTEEYEVFYLANK